MDAFACVRKEDFLFPPPWKVAITTPGYGRRAVLRDVKDLYQDMLVELVREDNINTGQPSLWASVFNWSGLDRGMSVFESGSGLGYFTAILSHVVGETGRVFYEEPHQKLQAQCHTNLKAVANTFAAYQGETLDRVYLCYGTTTVPTRLYLNIKVGGRIVFPFTNDWGHGYFLALEKTRHGCELHVGVPCSFVISRDYKINAETDRLGELHNMIIDREIIKQTLDAKVLDVAQMIHLALRPQSL